MTTYNGERFVEAQLRSILSELDENDEIIITDDCSNDKTVEIIRSINDRRVKLTVNDVNLGYIENFKKSISLATGKYVFLSDQDDIWPKGRVSLMLDELRNSQKSLIVGNMMVFTENSSQMHPFFMQQKRKNNRHYLRNFGRMLIGGIPYFGCCMLLDDKLKELFLKNFDKGISHDIQLAILANKNNIIYHIEDVVTFRREHDFNVTKSNRRFSQKLFTRLIWLKAMVRNYDK